MTPLYCPAPDRAYIEIRGADAASFLQGQLSRTVDSLESTEAPLAGWHDARGRVRSLFRVVRKADRWLLLAPRDGLAQTVARLKMFVLRAAVTVEAGDEWRTALLVDADTPLLGALGLPADAARNTLTERDRVSWVHLGANTWQAVGTSHAIESFDAAVARGPAALADLAEIRLGIPAIGASLADRFVAQMLNLDVLDAVSFDKGCYPGQEIIARVQHLGAVKRRMRRYSASAAALPAAGAAVLNESGAAAGEVIRAAPSGAGIELLAVVDHDASQGLLLVAGTALSELPLPYPLPSG